MNDLRFADATIERGRRERALRGLRFLLPPGIARPWLALAGLAFCGVCVGAEPDGSAASGVRFNPIAVFGLTGGGETIARYRGFFYGDEIDLNVDAGGTTFVYGGASFSWPRRHVGVLIQGGMFNGGFSNWEQSADFTRWPVELIGFVDWRRFRIGIGATRHYSPKFEDNGIEDFTIRFEDASGSLLQVDYAVDRFTVGLRRVLVDYTARAQGRPEVDGDHWGVAGSYRFGRKREAAR